MNKELLDRTEQVYEQYLDLVEKIPTEDKIIMAHEVQEENFGLEPWEISEIVQHSLNGLPDELTEHVDVLFDIVYDAVCAALDRVQS